METISNLHGLWSALAGGIGIVARSISADHFDFGMALQPGLRGFLRAIGEQIDDAMALQIDQNGPIVLSAFVGPVVESEYPHRFDFWGRHCSYASQQGGRSLLHPQLVSQLGASF